MSEEMVIRHCSPTLAGMKTGIAVESRFKIKLPPLLVFSALVIRPSRVMREEREFSPDPNSPEAGI